MYISDAKIDEVTEKIRVLYEKSFPKEEKKPFEIMAKKRDEGLMRFISIHDDGGEFLGFMLTAHHGRLVLLDYFAIEPKNRCMGVGSFAIRRLLEEYTQDCVVVEIEDERLPSDEHELRIRRRDFYLRSGLKIMPYDISFFGVRMRVLTSGGDVDFDEYHELYREVFGPRVAKNIIKV